MEESALKDATLCPQCLDACEFTNYHKTIQHLRPLIIEDNYGSGQDFSRYFQFDEKRCQRKDFCAYKLWDNDTIQRPTWLETLTEERKKTDANLNHMKDIIIVNIEFDSPRVEFNLLDTRYTILGQVASIGGILGLLVQMTGASVLTFFHAFTLMFKALFTYFLQHFQ